MDELLLGLALLEDELEGLDREEWKETLDELLPELAELCKRRWLLEWLVAYCKVRGNANDGE